MGDKYGWASVGQLVHLICNYKEYPVSDRYGEIVSIDGAYIYVRPHNHSHVQELYLPEIAPFEKKLNVYLDDRRKKPQGYDILIRTSEEVIEYIKLKRIAKVSLDNDLGINHTEGKYVAKFIEEAAFKGEIEPIEMIAHTDNNVARDEMLICFANAKKYWGSHGYL